MSVCRWSPLMTFTTVIKTHQVVLMMSKMLAVSRPRLNFRQFTSKLRTWWRIWEQMRNRVASIWRGYPASKWLSGSQRERGNSNRKSVRKLRRWARAWENSYSAFRTSSRSSRSQRSASLIKSVKLGIYRVTWTRRRKLSTNWTWKWET